MANRLTLTLTKGQKDFFACTGRTGGQTRAKNLTRARRVQIARKASKAAAKARTLGRSMRGIARKDKILATPPC